MLSLDEYESLIPSALRRSTSLSVIITDLAGKYTYTNEVFRRRFSFLGDDFLGMDVLDTIHPDDHQKCAATVERCFADPTTPVRVVLRKPEVEGTFAISDWDFSVLMSPQGAPAGVLCIGQDVTESEANARRLVAFHQKLSAVLNEIPDGFIELNESGHVLHANRAAEIVLDAPVANLQAQPLEAFIHPLHATRLRNEIVRVLEGLEHTIVEARAADFKRWFRFEVYPSPDGAHVYLSDITEERLNEMHRTELLELTLGQNERLRSFAHIVSHNLRSHANNIGALLKMLANDRPELNDERSIALLNDSAGRLQETVANLATVARMTSSTNDKDDEVCLHEKIEHALSVVAADLKLVNAECLVDVPKEWTVRGVNAYIESVLLNLLTNAVKYRHPERPLRIHITSKESDWFYHISVTDNGQGIDLERHGAKLFGMYRTFHEHPDAQGIGLFISKSQMEAMGGFISVESIHDEGSVFTVGFKKPTP